MRPFDSEHALPDQEEQREASAMLRLAVESKILASIDSLGSSARNAGVYSELALDSFDLDGAPIEVFVHSVNTVDHPDLPGYSVKILEGPRRLDGTFKNAHYYAIPGENDDRTVTRRDVSLPDPLPIELPTIHPNSIPADTIQKASALLLDAFQRAEQNQQLEKDLGLNDQPIGLAEARTIALLLSRGTVKVPAPRTSILKKPTDFRF